MSEETVGQRIQRIRLTRRGKAGRVLSQAELGERSGGKDGSYISKIERGDVDVPTLPTLQAIADGLGVAVEELAFEDRQQDVLDRVRRLLLADETMPDRRRREAVARVEEVYGRGRSKAVPS